MSVAAGLERKTNPELVQLIQELRRIASTTSTDIWADVAERLAGSHKSWAQVNVGKVGAVLQGDEIALVPGKVLSTGDAAQGLKVAAVAFSGFARQKIESAGGRCMTILEAVEAAPKGRGVRIVA